MMNIYIVIPLHNEEDILEKNIKRLNDIFIKILNKKLFNFILVDNDSTDGTAQKIEILKTKYKIQSTFCPQPNYGKAIKHGLNFLNDKNPDYIFLCDIEQWDEPFLKWSWAKKEVYDIFIGTKRSDYTLYKTTKLRFFLSWGLNSLINLCFKYPGTDIHGPKLINKSIYRNIVPECTLDRGQYDIEIVLKSYFSGYKIAEAPIIYSDYRKTRINIFKRIIYNLFAFYKLRKKISKYEKNSKHVFFNQFSRNDLMK